MTDMISQPVVGDDRATTADAHTDEVARGLRFEFGKNWARFLSVIDDERISQAEQSLGEMLGRARLDGLRFLDVGSGSGLFSLAARRLGADVRSFDYDPYSVACTRELKRRYFPSDPELARRTGVGSRRGLHERTRAIRRRVFMGCAPSHRSDVAGTRSRRSPRPGGRQPLHRHLQRPGESERALEADQAHLHEPAPAVEESVRCRRQRSRGTEESRASCRGRATAGLPADVDRVQTAGAA